MINAHQWNADGEYRCKYGVPAPIPTLIQRAQTFAHEAHDSISQWRKYVDAPYWIHTDAVAALVWEHTHDEILTAAANLHDVCEDVTPLNPTYSLARITQEFGPQVALHVVELTDVFTKEAYPHLNRAKRKELERNRKRGILAGSATIKLADICHNTEDIAAHDKGFGRVYIQEIELSLPMLRHGNSALFALATQSVENAKKILAT